MKNTSEYLPEYTYRYWFDIDTLTQTGWDNLCKNSRAIDIIKNNLDKISANGWERLCWNKNAKYIIRENTDKLTDECWNQICCYGGNFFIDMVEENLDKLSDKNWIELCKNNSAIHIIEKNLDKLKLIPKFFDSVCLNTELFEVVHNFKRATIVNNEDESENER